MARLSVSVLLCLSVCIFSAYAQSAGKQVQFFDGADFEGLLWQGPPLPESTCTVLPLGGQVRTSSLRTNVCIMIYPSITCSESYPTFSIVPGQYANLSTITHYGNGNTANDRVRAFRECREDEGDRAPHIEIWHRPVAAIETIVEYYNVTQCIDLPFFAQSIVQGVYNHGNCFELYNAANCTGTNFTLKGGVSRESQDLAVIGYAGQTLSLDRCRD